MSAVTNALKKAEMDRMTDMGSGERKSPPPSTPNTQEIWEEVRRLEVSLKTWDARATPPSKAQVPATSATGPGTGVTGNGPGTAAVTGLTGHQPVAQRVETATPSADALDQAFARCQADLLACEEQALRHEWEQLSLQTLVTTYEEVHAQIEGQLKSLRERAVRASEALASIKSTKISHLRQLASLRESRALVLRQLAQKQLQAAAGLADQILQSNISRGVHE